MRLSAEIKGLEAEGDQVGIVLRNWRRMRKGFLGIDIILALSTTLPAMVNVPVLSLCEALDNRLAYNAKP